MGRYEAKDGKVIPSAKIRAYLYGVMVAIGGVLIFYGVMTIEEVGVWAALGGVLLGTSNAIAWSNTADKQVKTDA